MNTNLIEIFYFVDEFCKEIEKTMEGHLLSKDASKKKRKRAFTMSDSEVITEMIMFHQSHYRDLKTFYIRHIQQHCPKDFPHTVSYNRFVELQQKALLPMVLFSFRSAVWVSVPVFPSLIPPPFGYVISRGKNPIRYSKA